MSKISIIGAGFAALTAAKKYRKLDPTAEITLIAPKAEFIYFPSLIWIPCGLRTGDDLRVDLNNFISKQNLKFHAGTVTGLEDAGRTVITDKGNVENDGLIIASGGRFIKKLPGIEHALTLCEGISATEKIAERLKAMKSGTIAVGFGGNPKEPSAMRGGPMFELLFGLDTLLRRQNRREDFEIIFFTPGAEPGKRLGERAVTGILKEMKKRDIKTQLGHKLKSFSNKSITTEGGEFDADLILFMPGMTGPQWLDNSELPRSSGGLVTANKQAKIEGFDNTFVAGDTGSFPGPKWMPKQAHMADLQADVAATNLHGEINNGATDAVFKIELVCIIDTLDKGILVFRNMKRTIVFPCKLLHFAKRLFEKLYLRKYR
ncbi:MAG: FAD-dependent oxidoreductase [Thiotrichaceae bacterium]|nr:FAD-dependent oxidoreductase [Thiotrichaceae bacterium]